MGLGPNSNQKLINKIYKAREEFIAKYGAKPTVLLISKENFLKVKAYAADHVNHPNINQRGSYLYDMWVICDPKVDLQVGGM